MNKLLRIIPPPAMDGRPMTAFGTQVLVIDEANDTETAVPMVRRVTINMEHDDVIRAEVECIGFKFETVNALGEIKFEEPEFIIWNHYSEGWLTATTDRENAATLAEARRFSYREAREICKEFNAGYCPYSMVPVEAE